MSARTALILLQMYLVFQENGLFNNHRTQGGRERNLAKPQTFTGCYVLNTKMVASFKWVSLKTRFRMRKR